MDGFSTDIWVKIIQEDLKTRREYGYSDFGEPEEDEEGANNDV